jgi:ABC-2 type transport system permease protein
VNATVVQLTLRTLLGRRRAWLLLVLPLVLVLLAVLLRLTVEPGPRDQAAADLLAVFAIGTIVPLLGLIAGTGAVGPEIDDGSIIYLLAKPLNRHAIALSKLAVAVGVVTGFGALPVALAGLLLSGTGSGIAVGFGLAALVAGVVYCAVFLLLAVVTRNAVVAGLLYVLVWESLVGSFVPGAQALSVQQWALSLARSVVDPGGGVVVTTAVGAGVGLPLLAAVGVAAAVLTGSRLRSLRLAGDE